MKILVIFALVFPIIANAQLNYTMNVSFADGVSWCLMQLWIHPEIVNGSVPRGIAFYFPGDKGSTIQTSYNGTDPAWTSIVNLCREYDFVTMTAGLFSQGATVVGESEFDPAFVPDVYDTMNNAIISLGKLAGYNYFANLPRMAYGISGGGSMANRLMLAFPSLAIAWAGDKGASSNNIFTADLYCCSLGGNCSCPVGSYTVINTGSITQVPGILTIGNPEQDTVNSPVRSSTVSAYASYRSVGAPVQLILDNGAQHGVYGTYGLYSSVLAFRDLIPLRFPTWSSYDPQTTTPSLVTLTQNSGYFGRIFLNPETTQNSSTPTWLGYPLQYCCNYYHFTAPSTSNYFSAGDFTSFNITWIPDAFLARIWVASSTTEKQGKMIFNGNNEESFYVLAEGTVVNITGVVNITVSGEVFSNIEWFVNNISLGQFTTAPYFVTYTLKTQNRYTMDVFYGTVNFASGSKSTTGFSLISVIPTIEYPLSQITSSSTSSKASSTSSSSTSSSSTSSSSTSSSSTSASSTSSKASSTSSSSTSSSSTSASSTSSKASPTSSSSNSSWAYCSFLVLSSLYLFLVLM